ncbi:MAG TPA: trigger factor [Jiangellaceae bacterium]
MRRRVSAHVHGMRHPTGVLTHDVQEYAVVKSVVETLNPTRVKLAVEVPFSELEPSIQSAYKKIAAQVTVPGFRKGRVPPVVIDQRFGREVVLQEAVNDALPALYGQALQDNELRPLGQPEVDVTDFGDGQELKFTAEVDVRPDVTLPEWEGLEVQVDDIEVTEEDVANQLTALQSRFGTLVGVDRPAADGDFVVIDLKAMQDGEVVEDGQATGVSYQIGVGAEMLDGMDPALTGLSAGESTTFKTTLVGTHEGMEVDCEVTVNAVKEQQLPDLDDEFAQLSSEFDTLDELRADLRERAGRAKRLQQAVEARDKILDTLLAAAGEIPLPEGVVAAEIERHFEDGHGDDDHRQEFERDLRKNLTGQFVLDELVKAEEIQVSQEELTSYIIERAAQAGIDPNQLAQQYVQSGNLPALMADVARGKALALVVEKAKVTDASGNEVVLDRLQEDGTIGQDEGAPAAVSPAATVPAGFEFAELEEPSDEPSEEPSDDPADEPK